MGLPPDEHLPEVVPDTSPQALSDVEAQYKRRELDERDKYPVEYDNAPKIPSDMGYLRGGTEPYAASSPDGSLPWEPLSSAGGDPGGGPPNGGGGTSEKPPQERRIWGLRRRTFFVVLVVVLVVIAAAIGGGVGGGVSAANRSTKSTPLSSSTSTPAPTSAPSSAPSSAASSTGSSPSPSPTFLSNDTVQTFSFQGFSKPNFDGAFTPVITTEGFHDLGMDCVSYVWLPNGTNCCITFCQGATEPVGWLCQTRRREQASDSFDRLYVWCNQDPTKTHANATCA